jgi:hypothetical protein
MTKPTDIARTPLGVEAFTITLSYKDGPIDALMSDLSEIADRAETPEEQQEVSGAIEALMVQYQPPLTDAEIAALGA